MIFKQSTSQRVYILLGALTFILVGLWSALFAGRVTGNEALYFFSVGQGDSSFIQLRSGVQVLIDGGPSGKVLLENLAKVMAPQDRYIDLVIMSHPELDHFAGLIDVLKKYKVGAFVGSSRKGTAPAYKELHQQIEKSKTPYLAVAEGDSITIGDAKISILSPSPQELLSGALNDTAIVALLETPDIKALYTGDIGFNVEDRLAGKYELDVDLLKVGHHGSRFSSGEIFLKKVTPSVAIIEVGKNTYGHPTKAALDRLGEYAQRIFRTDTEGILKVIAEAEVLNVFNLK